MLRRDVVVIGSGIGGSAAAALLARAGLSALLVEKNPRIGGSCGWYDKRGFRVDYGTHMFTRGQRGPLGVALRAAGAPHVQFLRVDDLAQVRGPGICLTLPAQKWKLPQFCVEAVRQLRIPLGELPKVVRLFWDLTRMPRHEAEAWDTRTIEEFIYRYTEHPRLFGLLGFLLGLYFILPPWEVSAGEAILAFQGMVRDNALSYVRGGSGAIPRAFVRALEKWGGEVRTRAGCQTIEASSHGAGGYRVALKDGTEVLARAVISTSSLPDLVRMVGAAQLPAEFVARTRTIKKSYVAVQAKVGLRKKREHVGCVVGGWARDASFDPWHVTRDDYQKQFASLDRGEVPVVVPVYCPIPSNFDPTLAPPGGQLLTACAVAPCTDVPRPEDTRPHARDDRAFIEGLLSAMQGLMPGCLDDAEFVDTMGTEALAAWIGKAGGPAVSTGQTPEQCGALRPSVRTPLPGLYVCGDAAGGRGIGTELAAASAMECVDAVLADLSRLSF